MRQPKPSRLDTTRDGQWLTLTKGPPLLPSRDFVNRHLEEQAIQDLCTIASLTLEHSCGWDSSLDDPCHK